MRELALVGILGFLAGIGVGGSIIMHYLRMFGRKRSRQKGENHAPVVHPTRSDDPPPITPGATLDIRCPNPGCTGGSECEMSSLDQQARACAEILWQQAPRHLEEWGFHPASASLAFAVVLGRCLDRLREAGMLDAVRAELPGWVPAELVDSALAAWHWSREEGAKASDEDGGPVQ